MTHYIVTGQQRSGTSGMMQSLEAGGMEVVYNEEYEKILQGRMQTRGYNPNPRGFYELDGTELSEYQWKLWDLMGEKVTKLPFSHDYIIKMPTSDIRVVMMWRDLAELIKSWHRSYGQSLSLESFEKQHEYYRGILTARSDLQLLTCRYPDLVKDPEEIFTLMEKMGWPIDIELAAQAVDPELYRNQK